MQLLFELVDVRIAYHCLHMVLLRLGKLSYTYLCDTDNKKNAMRTIKLKGKNIELYDDIEMLPIKRFHKYNKMLLIDSGVGSDLNDFDRHLANAMQWAMSKTPQNAVTELENLRQNVYFIQSNLSPKCLAFAVLVKSIDGAEQSDLSDEALQKIVDMLADVPQKELTDHLESVKKKINDELRLYFPKLFEDASLKEYYDKLRKRTLAILRTVVANETNAKDQKEIDDITTTLMTYFNPHVFGGNESVEIKQDKQFEKMCLILSQKLHVEPKKFTVMEFYNAFEYIQEQAREEKKALKRK